MESVGCRIHLRGKKGPLRERRGSGWRRSWGLVGCALLTALASHGQAQTDVGPAFLPNQGRKPLAKYRWTRRWMAVNSRPEWCVGGPVIQHR